MSEKSQKVKERITEVYGKLFREFGVKPTMMDVYLAIFFSTEPIGFKEISEKTGYSITTVSNTMPIVERIFDIKSFRKPKSKKIYYQCKHDAFDIFKKKLKFQMAGANEILKFLRECEEELAGEKNPEAIECRGYIRKLREDYEVIVKMFSRLVEIHQI